MPCTTFNSSAKHKAAHLGHSQEGRNWPAAAQGGAGGSAQFQKALGAACMSQVEVAMRVARAWEEHTRLVCCSSTSRHPVPLRNPCHMCSM